jgi:hypothetical protein
MVLALAVVLETPSHTMLALAIVALGEAPYQKTVNYKRLYLTLLKKILRPPGVEHPQNEKPLRKVI